MLFFIVFAIATLIAIGAAAAADEHGFIAVCGIVALGIMWFAFSATTVSARAVGIEVAYGRYVSTLDNGFHMKRPWASVQEFSTQVQYLDYGQATGKASNDSVTDPIAVTYKSSSGGSVETTIRWRIDPAKAQALWAKYKDFDSVRDQLVLSSGRDSFGVQVSNYTPVDARTGENRRAITNAVKADMDSELAVDGIIIDSVSIKKFDLDPVSQAALDQVVAANANLAKATIATEIAHQEALAIQKKKDGGALTPQGLQQACLTIVQTWDVGRQGPMPTTFNCALTAAAGNPLILAPAGK